MFPLAPTHHTLWTFKNAQMKHLTMRFFFFTGCGIGSVQRSLYIHLLSLLPWQGKEELCLQKLHCSHFPPLPSHLMVAMETSRMSMTALCVRYAGRGDVMCFSPPTMAFTLLCQRLSTSASLIPWLCGTYRHMCEHGPKGVTEWRGQHLPQVWIATLSEVLITKCHSKAFCYCLKSTLCTRTFAEFLQ